MRYLILIILLLLSAGCSSRAHYVWLAQEHIYPANRVPYYQQIKRIDGTLEREPENGAPVETERYPLSLGSFIIAAR